MTSEHKESELQSADEKRKVWLENEREKLRRFLIKCQDPEYIKLSEMVSKYKKNKRVHDDDRPSKKRKSSAAQEEY